MPRSNHSLPMAQLPSPRGRSVQELWDNRTVKRTSLCPFQISTPALDQFPVKLWRKLESRHFEYGDPSNLTFGDPAGYLPLREAISEHLRMFRAMVCDASQILITSGSRQGMNLAAQVLLDPGENAWIEDPVSFDVFNIFKIAGALLVPVRVDEQGLDVPEGIALAPLARLAYVSPSQHYPLGMTLSLSRRLALLDWASRTNAWIIEDDLDCEYRYVGRSLPSLHSLDNHGRVIYVGTFSRAMFPGLRLGYIVVPKGLMGTFTAARHLLDIGSSLVSQKTMSDFITEGHFYRHLRRIRTVHAERRDIMVKAIRDALGHILTVQIPEAGLYALGLLKDGLNDVDIAKKAAKAGISLIALSPYYQCNPAKSGLIFGFAGFPGQSIQKGIRRLSKIQFEA